MIDRSSSMVRAASPSSKAIAGRRPEPPAGFCASVEPSGALKAAESVRPALLLMPLPPPRCGWTACLHAFDCSNMPFPGCLTASARLCRDL